MNAINAMIVLCMIGCSSGPRGKAADTKPRESGQAARTPSGPSPLIGDAAIGVSNAELADLLRDAWEWRMEQSPTQATTLGDHRYDDRIADRSRLAIERARKKHRLLLARAAAIDRGKLGVKDAITLALFIEQVESAIASEVCEFESWNVSPHRDPSSIYNRLPQQHRIRSSDDAANLLARYRAIPKAIDDLIANLERGADAGLFSNVESVRRTIEMVDGQLDQPIADWALLEPLATIAEVGGRRAEELQRSFRDVVAEEIASAYRRYRDFLATHVLSRARSGDRVGLHALPNGVACYAARIQHHIGLARSAEELHQLGLSEVRRINDDMRALGQSLFGTDDLAEILAHLRSDRSLYFDSAEAMLEAARKALDRANAAMPRAFGRLPRAPCTVVPIPDYEAPFTTIAYYRPPHYDGSKPGEYFVNVYQPHTRPRYEFQALSFHEAVPGHHLQIAIARELEALPALRKFAHQTAFGEGWALYTEKLADELGLYDGDLDRMGMFSYDAWRASRLVVDTGIHALGWTRERAEQFMRQHTALAENNISNEVDRYIARPGQALAYKVGQLEILRLRAWAQKELGERFSLPGFHDTVLGQGSVSLNVLARQVEDWVAAQKNQ